MTEKLKISRESILELANILKESDLTEIEYETDQGRIRVVRNFKEESQTVFSIPSSAIQSPQQTKEVSSVVDVLSHPGTIKSPMVGMVYLSSEPNSAPFVTIGDRISVGQTLLIIESMKVMNPIKATKAGTVINILAKDATPVEFNEPLIVIE